MKLPAQQLLHPSQYLLCVCSNSVGLFTTVPVIVVPYPTNISFSVLVFSTTLIIVLPEFNYCSTAMVITENATEATITRVKMTLIFLQCTLMHCVSSFKKSNLHMYADV